MSLKQKALDYHEGGKIEINVKKPCVSAEDLSLAYSPGVAEPCIEIESNNELAYKYTNKGNLVAVITDSTAVLGLGDIGAIAGKPVMEGKSVLFKKFANVDAFDIELDEKDPDKIVEICKALAPTFGGINLEDIAAPKCFYIEKKLQESVNIPVMHDDQHGTAIITTAGLLNALEINGKDINKIKVVVSGSGAAGIACAKMYQSVGVKNIIMCDSKGVIHSKRDDLTEQKMEFAIDIDDRTLGDALRGADMFLGLSKAKLLTPDMVKSMANNPIIFALANPEPEIRPEIAHEIRDDIIIGTGRSDYPNQVNNVLGFPFIFRGALDARATKITENMKIAAAIALAKLAKESVPSEVCKAYNVSQIKFGKDYIIPKPFDPRVLFTVAPAVAKAAVEDGVALVKEFDESTYIQRLKNLF
ncbi:malic enzyme-like NAD(P)-binding protein [Campylobacter lanienae]|uniref:malic enzyme-like NAD(P)-binding protein n=1 Tax=Campylobacter lanienae TaxID=75658 RepID=UPI002A909384|nr:malic enzyme-like NAD(P)-binding protein [Campylobacter lanienae]MDY6134110.1 malic enzyme-like NAD(P)-binding protein [Campylobacter lanienae]